MNLYEDESEKELLEGEKYLDVEGKYKFEYRPLFIIKKALFNVASWISWTLFFCLYVFIFFVFSQVGLVVGMWGVLNLILGQNVRFVDLFMLIDI